MWSISTTGSLRAHSSVREKRNRKHPAVKEPREQRGLTLRKKQGLGFGLFFLKEENAIAEWEAKEKRMTEVSRRREQRETVGRQRKGPGSPGGKDETMGHSWERRCQGPAMPRHLRLDSSFC